MDDRNEFGEIDMKVLSLGPKLEKNKRQKKEKQVEESDKLSQFERQLMMSHFINDTDSNPAGFSPPKKFVLICPNNIEKIVYEITDDGEVLRSDITAVVSMLGWCSANKFAGNPILEMSNTQIDQAADFWLKATEPIPEPRMLAWKGENCLAYRKLPFDLGFGETPLFDEMMSRITNSQALMAFIGSLLFPESYLHQYVWIQGEGGDGKSSLCRALDKALAHICEAKNVPDKRDNFWLAGLKGKRLTIFSDCSNTQWVTSGMFKSLTGGDAQSLEDKFEKSRKEYLNTKFIFTSNEKPSLTTEKADYRRIIYCEISRFSNDYNTKYDEMLFKEAGYFFSKCSSLYLSLCPNHEAIPADYSQILNQMSVTEEPYEMFFNKYFVLSDGDSVTPTEYYACLKQEFRKPKHQAEFRQWLKKTHNIEKTSVPGKTDYEYKGMRRRPGSLIF